MKFFKFLLFLLFIVIIGGSIYFATQDKSYQIESQREINAPKEVVYNIVNNLKTWEDWGPWKVEDPTRVFNYEDKTAGEGASYSWQGTKDGSLEITKALPHISIDLTQTQKLLSGAHNSKMYWTFESLESLATVVTWGIEGELSIIDKAYYTATGIDFENNIRESFEIGLDGLKNSARKEVTAYSSSIDGITQYSGGFYLYRTTSAKAQNVPTIMSQNYSGISEFMAKNDISQSGMPFTIYNQTMDNGDVIMTNAIPVREKIIVAGDGNVLSGYMPTVTAIKVTAKGNYTHLGEAWVKVMQEVASKNYELADEKPFEVYVTDPIDYPNPADWVTEIYVPIKDLE